MAYSIKQLASAAGIGESTMRKRLKELKTEPELIKKFNFKKTSPGKYYSDPETKIIAAYIQFDFSKLK